MFNPYVVIVRRVVDHGTGPAHLVQWVQAELRRQSHAAGTPLSKDRLVHVLADQLVRRVVVRRGADTRLKQLGQTVRLEAVGV